MRFLKGPLTNLAQHLNLIFFFSFFPGIRIIWLSSPTTIDCIGHKTGPATFIFYNDAMFLAANLWPCICALNKCLIKAKH